MASIILSLLSLFFSLFESLIELSLDFIDVTGAGVGFSDVFSISSTSIFSIILTEIEYLMYFEMMATFLNKTGFFIYWFTKFENLTTVCDIEISSNSDLEVHTKSELVEISLSYPVYPDLFLSNLPSDEI